VKQWRIMKIKKLHPLNLVMRCIVLKRRGCWVAICVDLDLAVQADTHAQAKKLLSEQMRSYVEDSLTVDAEHAPHLLTRKAPLAYIAMYYGIKWLNRAKGWLSYETALPLAVSRA